MTALDAAAMARLAAISEHLIPEAHGMPSAGDVVTDERLAFVLGSRPDLAEPLRAALRPELGDDVPARVGALAARESGTLASLQLVIVAAYYTDDGVRERLGYPGQLAVTVDPEAVPEYVQEGLIERARARGPVWRDPATGRRAEKEDGDGCAGA